jgi:hypothetical protein
MPDGRIMRNARIDRGPLIRSSINTETNRNNRIKGQLEKNDYKIGPHILIIDTRKKRIEQGRRMIMVNIA